MPMTTNGWANFLSGSLAGNYSFSMVGYSCILVLFLAANQTVIAAERNAQPWAGRWVWTNDDTARDSWVCFRKRFPCAQVPAQAIARIAAESRYWMWINGKLVIFEGGLKRGPAPGQTWYDEVELAPHLKKGDNTIAILAWYWGRSSFDCISAGKAGLLFDANIGGIPVKSDESWKTKVHPAFQKSTHRPDKRLVEYSILFDGRADLIDWSQPEFDDAGWAAAVEKGTPPCAPWGELLLRPIPQWRDMGLRDYVDAPKLPFTANGKPLKLQLHSNVQFSPCIKVNDPEGGKTIDMMPAASSMKHEYITRKGQQHYEGQQWVTAGAGATITYTIPAGIEVQELKYRETGYDCDLRGTFNSGDALLDKYWIQAQRTCYVNMRDTLMGCPDRERGGFLGDQNVMFMYMGYCLDPSYSKLANLVIKNNMRWQHANKALPCVAPGTFNGEFPAMSLAYIGRYGIWEYYMQSGDAEALRFAYPHAKAYLDLYQFDADGVVVERPGGMGNWMDWGNNIDHRLLINCWYYSAAKWLMNAARLGGHEADVPELERKVQKIEQNFGRVFWDGAGYRSPNWTKPHDDRGNALAVCLGLAEREKWPTIRKILVENLFGSPQMERFPHEALFTMGQPEEALQRLRKRYAYVQGKTFTLGENWGPANHGYAGGSLATLSGTVAGVAPLTAGYATFRVTPALGNLNKVSCLVPSPKGDIEVTITRDKADGTCQISLTAPPGTKATLGMHKNVFADVGRRIVSVTLADREVWRGKPLAALPPGAAFAGDDDEWIKFTLVPGQWVMRGTTEAIATTEPAKR
ncbi:MAG: alpha-L-rhamnosidase C-terminal domain-containing protein [Phycisphaerae bacterium]